MADKPPRGPGCWDEAARAVEQSPLSREGWTAASVTPGCDSSSPGCCTHLRTALLCLQIPPCPIKHSRQRASRLESLEGQRVNNIRRLINIPPSQEPVPTEDALRDASCTQGFFLLCVCILKALAASPKWAISIWRPDVFLYQQGREVRTRLPVNSSKIKTIPQQFCTGSVRKW